MGLTGGSACLMGPLQKADFARRGRVILGLLADRLEVVLE